MRTRILFVALVSALTCTAGVVTFSDLTAFQLAAPGVGVITDFDGLAPGTIVSGGAVGTFTATGGNTLYAVAAASTFSTLGGAFPGYSDASLASNKLPATSGAMILSPGGAELVPGPAVAQEDGITIGLSKPFFLTLAFGFDLLFQSYDFGPFVTIQVFDQNNALVFSGSPAVPGSGGAGAPGGSVFWGVVANGGTVLSRIEVLDDDRNNDNPDSNIGYDSFRAEVLAVDNFVPEPGSLALMGLGLSLVAALRLRR